MLQETLFKIQLPALRTDAPWETRRIEIFDLLETQIYGRPIPPMSPVGTVTGEERICAGNGILTSVTLSFPQIGFSFPLRLVRPQTQKKAPVFVFLNFGASIYHKYLPLEEILNNGFGVAYIYYNDVTTDDNDFTNGLAGALHTDCSDPTAPGKIAMWAWAASRAVDYLETTDWVDLRNIAVIGHSRLGKTALVAGAYDERFRFVFSNDSGCSGAAITRGKRGERVRDICEHFPYWFCENYQQYIDREESMPFDQHFLLALSAPRILGVHSAIEDTWADPYAEYLSCAAASEAWECLGETGFVSPDRLPQIGDRFNQGCITYALRSGSHYLSLWDWRRFMECVLTKLK